MDPREKLKYLREEKNIEKLSKDIVTQQDEKMLGIIPKRFPDVEDIGTATKVIKGLNNPSDAVVEAIKKDKNVQKIIKKQKEGELTSTADKFMDPGWQASREFNFNGTIIKGYDNAINHYYGTGSAKKDKIVHIMIGTPASGKSTKAKTIADHFGSKIIDSDDFKLALTGRKNTSATSAVHEEGKFLVDRALSMAAEKGDNIVYPIIGKNEDKVMSAINKFNQNDYVVKLVYAKSPTNVARMKNIQRGLVTGRLIPDEYFSQDLDNKIQFVYDVVSPKVEGAATIKTGTVRKGAIVKQEKKGIEIY
jgi:predicted kinase